MRLYARFEGLGKRAAVPRVDELLADMALDHKRDATIRTLSGGMKRRLTFCPRAAFRPRATHSRRADDRARPERPAFALGKDAFLPADGQDDARYHALHARGGTSLR
jgi:hypothetical protein